jgi:hypothetical protein
MHNVFIPGICPACFIIIVQLDVCLWEAMRNSMPFVCDLESRPLGLLLQQRDSEIQRKSEIWCQPEK